MPDEAISGEWLREIGWDFVSEYHRCDDHAFLNGPPHDLYICPEADEKCEVTGKWRVVVFVNEDHENYELAVIATRVQLLALLSALGVPTPSPSPPAPRP
jgi:hypothetical protein